MRLVELLLKNNFLQRAHPHPRLSTAQPHQILEESDGIMVARGDLGVEIPIQQVTIVQKDIVAKCNAVGKPVIVATQMLESMAKNPRPTRAEVADVTNAVFDGADCVMLSGETAKGKYPVESVRMMKEIVIGAEKFATARPELCGGAPKRPTGLGELVESKRNVDHRSSLSIVARSAVMAADQSSVKALIVLTLGGYMPRLMSAHRPNVPILAFCPSEKLGRQLTIHKGVHPIIALPGTSRYKRTLSALKDATKMGYLETGDQVVVVAVDIDDDYGKHATMRVVTVPDFEEKVVVKKDKVTHPPCV